MTTRRPDLSRSTSLVITTIVFVSVLVAAGAPSPLYSIMRQQWGFPAWVLTVAFSVYALALVLALVTVGSLSDHLGRRPVLLAALAAELCAMVVIAVAPDVRWVILGRVLQGFATGAATATFSALLTDLSPVNRVSLGMTIVSVGSQAGMAIGALSVGAVASVVADPVTPVFLVLAITTALGLLAVFLLPETSRRAPGISKSLIPRVGVPAGSRHAFFSLVPGIVAIGMTGGFFMSLFPSVLLEVFDDATEMTGGVAIALLAALGAVWGAASFRVRSRPAAIIGMVVVAVGFALVLLSIDVGTLPGCLASIVVMSVGFGVGNAGLFRLAGESAPVEQRAGLFAAVHLVSYLAYGGPVVLTGFLAGHWNLASTTYLYGAVVVAMAATGLTCLLRASRTEPGTRRSAKASEYSNSESSCTASPIVPMTPCTSDTGGRP